MTIKALSRNLKRYAMQFSLIFVMQRQWFLTGCTRRPVTSLGHQEGRRLFREGPKFFELCPMFSNCVQHIFPGGAKIF